MGETRRDNASWLWLAIGLVGLLTGDLLFRTLLGWGELATDAAMVIIVFLLLAGVVCAKIWQVHSERQRFLKIYGRNGPSDI